MLRFLPQTKLEEWALSEQADLMDGKLVIKGEAQGHAVMPAVHFAKLVSGGDEHKLLDKVKTQAQIAALGGEQMFESVVLGDSAYEVVTGYVTQLGGPAASPPAGKGPGRSETSILADYLLGKL
ncbi:MAG: hypothetical protein ACKVPX_02075 [Myxococcaceae bacterium]